MRKTSLTVIACALLLCAGTAQAKLSAQLACKRQKLDVDGELQECLKQNNAGILAGQPDASAKCQKGFINALALADKAATRSGESCRYLDNGDGTVSDLNTGLMWEQKTKDGSVHDVNNTYTLCNATNLDWDGTTYECNDPMNAPPDGTAFTTFFRGLNGGTSSDGSSTSGCFAGHCDWRLPLIEELRGIFDGSATGCGSGSPCIDPTFGPTQSNGYWSATTRAGVVFKAWDVDFYNGGLGNVIKGQHNEYVRAVRSGL